MWENKLLQFLRLVEDSGRFGQIVGTINDPAVPWTLAIAILLWALVEAGRFYWKLRPIYRRTQRANQLLLQSPNNPAQFASMSAYADTRPATGNDTEEGRRQNRRIDLRFILATPDEGELDEVRRRLRVPGDPP